MTVDNYNKPVSPSCDRNRDPILAVLSEELKEVGSVLEIGSGTGQHAVYMAENLPHLQWQCSDLAGQLAGIRLWIEESGLKNLLPPLELDVSSTKLHDQEFSAIFTANTLHIMSLADVEAMFGLISRHLCGAGKLCVYGPFNYDGQFTSASNADFDQWLKARNPLSGIRDFEVINAFAAKQGLELLRDQTMPANNRMLVWQKQ